MMSCFYGNRIGMMFHTNHLVYRAYGKAGNGNEMETGNGNWKQMGTKDTLITGAMFSS